MNRAMHHVASRERAFSRAQDDLLRIAAFYPCTAGGISGQNPGEAILSPNVLDVENHIQFAQTAEAVGLDYLFMAEVWNPGGEIPRAANVLSPWVYNPVLAGIAIPVTRRIGIVTTLHFSFLAPVVVARLGASLDAMSGGRWAMNIVTGPGNADGLVPEPMRSLGHDERYAYATEAMEVILALWRGEEMDHAGKYLSLKGRLYDPLPLQQPPGLISAGASGPGKEFAAQFADYLFTIGGGPDAQHVQELDGLDQALQRHGRKPGSLKHQVRATTFVRDTQSEVDQFVEKMESYFDEDLFLDMALGHGIKRFGSESLDSARQRRLEESGLDVAVARRRSAVSTDLNLQGTPQRVADILIKNYRERDLRGVALLFQDWHPHELRQFAEKVMPLIREEGIWAPPSERGYSW